MTSQLPEEWAALSSLTCVDLSRNKLNGWLPASLFEEWGRGTRLRQRAAAAGKGAGVEAEAEAEARRASRGGDRGGIDGGSGGGGGYQGGRDGLDGEDAKGRDERDGGERSSVEGGSEEGVVVGQGLRSLSLHHNHFHGPLPDTLRLLKVRGGALDDWRKEVDDCHVELFELPTEKRIIKKVTSHFGFRVLIRNFLFRQNFLYLPRFSSCFNRWQNMCC